MDKNSKISFFLEIAREKISRLFYAVERIETKASIIIGFVGVMLGYILASFDKYSLRLTMLSLSITFLFISFVFAILVILTEKYRSDPDLEKLYYKYKNKNSEEVKKQLFLNLTDSYNENKTQLHGKVKLLKHSLIFLLLGLFLLVIRFLLIIIF